MVVYVASAYFDYMDNDVDVRVFRNLSDADSYIRPGNYGRF